MDDLLDDNEIMRITVWIKSARKQEVWHKIWIKLKATKGFRATEEEKEETSNP